MNKIAASAKFQELLKKFSKPPETERPTRNEVADTPNTLRRSARKKVPSRNITYDVPLAVPKRRAGTPATKPVVQVKERSRPNLSVSKSTKNNTKPTPECVKKIPIRRSESPPPPKDTRRGRPVPSHQDVSHRKRPHIVDDVSEEEFLESASAVGSPPRPSAFSRVYNGSPRRHQANRDPRLQLSNRYTSSTNCQFPSSHHEQAVKRPNIPAYETSMRNQFQPREILTNQHYSSSRFQPYVRLEEISRERTQRWDDGFLRPPTPPQAREMVEIEKSKLQESIDKMIDCPLFSTHEIVFALNSIQATIVAKMEKFWRKQDKLRSILQQTMSETMQMAEETKSRAISRNTAGLTLG